MTQRDFKAAALLFLETMATFTSTELMEMKEFVMYTVLMSTFSLSRTDIKAKVRSLPSCI
jgi:26S proteasome regulatory subunit N7